MGQAHAHTIHMDISGYPQQYACLPILPEAFGILPSSSTEACFHITIRKESVRRLGWGNRHHGLGVIDAISIAILIPGTWNLTLPEQGCRHLPNHTSIISLVNPERNVTRLRGRVVLRPVHDIFFVSYF